MMTFAGVNSAPGPNVVARSDTVDSASAPPVDRVERRVAASDLSAPDGAESDGAESDEEALTLAPPSGPAPTPR